jgi:membrane-bound lytic murein transglycosylase D
MKSVLNANWKWIIAGLAGGFAIMNVMAFEDKPLPKEIESANDGYYKVFSPGTPASMTFAGEEVPLSLIDVREKLDRELLVNTYWHSNTFLMIKRANRWFEVIEPILEVEGIPSDFKYLALIESGLTNVVSPAGATGFWQFMKETGKSYDLEVTSEVDERYHVEKATIAACQYLNDAYDRFGDWALVAASYNMGMGGLNKRLNAQKVDNYWDLLLNNETGRYVYRILAVKEILSHPGDFGFVLEEDDMYHAYEVRTITVDSAITDLAAFALDQGINYKVLKTLNPWLKNSKLTNKYGKDYQIKLPSNPSNFRLD